MTDNYYEILGVSENATKDEIKKSYRSLQLKYHPDKNGGNIELSTKINQAYEVLGDEDKKKSYDYERSNPNPFMRMNSNTMNAANVEDIINMMFGGQSFQMHGMPGMGMPGMGMPGMSGMPLGQNIHIFNGAQMHNFQSLQKPIPIIKTITINLSQLLTKNIIPLDIERWIIENGNKVFENDIINVTIPCGIDDTEIIILRDKGNVLNDTIKGDVKVFIKINNDTLFKRSGLDLILDKTITLKEALCGFSFEIIYINGKSYTLNNNKGNIILPEYKKIYTEMGLIRNQLKGNMIIHFHVEFPEKLNNEQITQLLEIL